MRLCDGRLQLSEENHLHLQLPLRFPENDGSVQVRLCAGEEDFLAPIFVVDGVFFISADKTRPSCVPVMQGKFSHHYEFSSSDKPRVMSGIPRAGNTSVQIQNQFEIHEFSVLIFQIFQHPL